MTGPAIHLPYDWYAGGIPANVVVGRDVYLDSSYGFAACRSERSPAVTLGDACGAYDRAAFVVGPRGAVTVGAYTVLNGSYIVCSERVEIGAHCLLAWGVVVTDSWLPPGAPAAATREARRAALRATAADRERRLVSAAPPRPVVLEDNCWVGFDAVILPGVRLGRGCIVGCRTVVREDVPPYAIVAGDPPRLLRYLAPDDAAAREAALRQLADPRPVPA